MLATVGHFLQWIDGLDRDHYLWRGQADCGWQLTSSVGRSNGVGIDSKDELKSWIAAVEQFVDPKPVTNLEWLVLAQHYGIATPLLDWSLNPLFALYFAASEIPEKDGVVFALREGAFPSDGSFTMFGPLNQEQCAIVRTVSMNRRTRAQQSAMTIQWPRQIDLCDHAAGSLHRFTLPAKEKADVLSALNLLGVNRTTMMSDLHTAVQAYKDRLEVLKS